MSLVARQISIECKYSKSNIRKIVKDEITKDFTVMYKLFDVCEDLSTWMKAKHYDSKQTRLKHLEQSSVSPIDLVLDIMVSVLAKGGQQPVQSVAGIVAPSLDYENVFDGIRTVAEVIGIMCEHDLFDVVLANHHESGRMSIVPLFQLRDEVRIQIERFKYLPPMVAPPFKVSHNKDFDYHTVESSKILGKGNHHEFPQALDVINILNNQRLCLDMNVLGLEESPNKPLDTQEKIDQFKMMKDASRFVYQEMLDAGNEFYFTHKYDKRGRVYSQG